MIPKKLKTVSNLLSSADNPFWLDPDLPWRKAKTPYNIFLSEFLLVRTRTDVVSKVYKKLVLHYPDIESLYNANIEELKKIINPLGMNKRIKYLVEAAKFIIENFGGEIPQNKVELIKIPGIGVYTSTAISNFAFGIDEVPADVNIFRFLSRITGFEMEHPTKGSKKIQELLPFLTKEKGGPKLDSLIDFCRNVCSPRKPNCNKCILIEECEYFKNLFD